MECYNMNCNICNKKLNNFNSKTHEINCILEQKYSVDVIKDYLENYLSVRDLSIKYNVSSRIIYNILSDKRRNLSESAKISNIRYPRKLSNETKNKLSIFRLDWMKNNPEKTAWRLSNQSYPEKVFENIINKNYEYTKEKSIFPYYIDFAFEKLKIAVEIDGSQHENIDRKYSDIKKDSLLLSQNWRILRISVKYLISNKDNILNVLENFINSNSKYQKY